MNVPSPPLSLRSWTLPSAGERTGGRCLNCWTNLAVRALLVDREHESPRLSGLAGRTRLVVEDRDQTAAGGPDVMLEGKVRAVTDLEVAALAAEGPDHLTGPAMDLVERPRVAARDQQVAV